MSMDFRILGPVEVLDDDGRPVALGGTRQRALLAALLLHPNEVVAPDRLLDELWGENPPSTGAKALHVAVSQLRKALGDGVLETRPSGYLLRFEPESLDLACFERLRAKARAALADGDAAEASAALREALALWRGPALADLAYEPFARDEAERLEELRLVALEERIEADLALGRHGELVGELEALVAKHPLREGFRALLMLALYRSGRQAEALDLYRDTRRMLADELGIEPSTRLQELERAILRHDPSLEQPAAAPPVLRAVRTAGRRRPLVAAGVAAAAVAVGAVAFVLLDDEPTLAAVAPNSVAVIDPQRNALVAQVPVGDSPGPMVTGGGAVWVLNRNSRTVTQIDTRTRAVVSTSGVGETPGALALGVWLYVLDGATERLWVLDPASKVIYGAVVLDRSGAARPGADVAAWGEEVWVTDELPPSLIWVRPDPLGSPVDRLELPGSPSAVAVESERVWVTLDEGALALVDRRKRAVERTIEVGRGPSGVALGAGAVWVANASDGTVTRVRPRPLDTVATIRVGREPGGLAVGAGAVWVANRRDGTVSRIDPRTNEVVATIRVGHRPEDVVVAGGLVWVSVREK